MKVTLGIRQSGAMAPVVGLSVAGMTRRYVEMEAASLEHRREGGRAPA